MWRTGSSNPLPAPGLGLLLVVVVVLGCYLPSPAVAASLERVCQGTTNGFSRPGRAWQRYEDLKRRYTNCTVVNGNLEIAYLDEEDTIYDLSFLSQIQVVTGYLLCVSVQAEELPLTSLRVIQGQSLFPFEPTITYKVIKEEYSVGIVNNFQRDNSTVGLKKLRFTSLRAILAGHVLLYSNRLLCNDNTVLWEEILRGYNATVKRTQPYRSPDCESCHPDCKLVEGRRYCWGPGRDECQSLTKHTCSAQCEPLCYGDGPSECCHPECAAGCDGPGKEDCWACQTFLNEGSCVPFCPPEQIYDHKQYRLVQNPQAKVALGNVCTRKCPENLVVESGACLEWCSIGKAAENGMCVPCEGPCSKPCRENIEFVGCTGQNPSSDEYLTIADLERFEGCTKILGSVRILLSGMHPSSLSVFQDVREITGRLIILGPNPQIQNASFLSNLEVIGGLPKVNYTGPAIDASLSVAGTRFRSLGLSRLRLIRNGAVMILINSDLCYAASTRFDKIMAKMPRNIHVNMNREERDCRNDSLVCHPECSDDGCWGPGNTECLSCRNLEFGEQCVSSCGVHSYTTNSHTCHRCHAECEHCCHGPGPNDCIPCEGQHRTNQSPRMKLNYHLLFVLGGALAAVIAVSGLPVN